jgi:hypothetical protein
VLTLLGRQHSNDDTLHLELNRRRLLKLGIASIVAASVPGRPLSRNLRRSLALRPSLRTTRRPMVVLARIRFPGSTRMAIPTRARWRMWNFEHLSLQREAGALQRLPRQIARWQASTGLPARRTKRSSPTRD